METTYLYVVYMHVRFEMKRSAMKITHPLVAQFAIPGCCSNQELKTSDGNSPFRSPFNFSSWPLWVIIMPGSFY
jgi:hypothetical protein